jgi:hypothetical protein
MRKVRWYKSSLLLPFHSPLNESWKSSPAPITKDTSGDPPPAHRPGLGVVSLSKALTTEVNGPISSWGSGLEVP